MRYPRRDNYGELIDFEARKAGIEQRLDEHRSSGYSPMAPVEYKPPTIVVRKPWGELLQRNGKWGVITRRQIDGKRMWHGEFHYRHSAAKALEEALSFDWVYYKERMQDDATRTTAEHGEEEA